MKLRNVLTDVLAIGVALATPAFAQPLKDSHAGMLGSECPAQIVEYLGLTAAQQTFLDTIRQQAADDAKPVADEIRSLRLQIEASVAAVSPDACAIGHLEIQEHSLFMKLESMRKSADAAFSAQLTADQITKFATFSDANPFCAAITVGPLVFISGPPSR